MRRSGFIGDQEENNAPMIEIFGGVFALLLVLFLLMNLLSQASLRERLEQASEEGAYKVGWGASGAGFVVIAYPDRIHIIETGEAAAKGAVCAPDSPYIPYAQRVYGGDKQQLIFAILEGGVATMAEARNCLRSLTAHKGQEVTIGWIIADNELLKSVSIGDIPPHIQEIVGPGAQGTPSPQAPVAP